MWWLIPELVLLAVLAALYPVVAQPSLTDELAAQTTSILERHGPAGHHRTDSAEVFCATEIMGFEPADATSPEEVSTVYVYFLCASGEPGMSWDYASRIAGPAAINLAEPPRVRIAESGSGYPDRVRALIPASLQPRAFSGFIDSGVPAQVRRQFD